MDPLQKDFNGRVDIIGPKIEQQFAMYDKIPAHQCIGYRDAMMGNWNNTQLSDTFFSGANIATIQQGIREGVYNMSKGAYQVGQQDCDVLKIIMRSIFLQYSANVANNIQGQINALNKLVLDYAVPQVYSGAQSYMKYAHDASTLVTPISNPVATSTSKTLELKRFF
tara:strand:- start:38 stop:538 length:501 start_codon:yes stop_codon:yes gene_type:complete